ncbi:hypothetical protein KDA_61640 [Dictyobacter alpinus]|uniref:HEAT repeat domain-containing protein n=2 Tax=Dictyobacter alpinus TaxID=2014873 RepID=A0A402BHC2_9CHLR|nr:hypothetical protein KDA_61640 [Dictyobacter alpinus]
MGNVAVIESLIAILLNSNEHEGKAMDVSVVSSLVSALRKLNDARAVEPLLAALERKDEQTRAVIALSLGSFGDMCAVEPLINLLHDQEPLIRRAAACVLGDLADRRAVPPLLAILDDPDLETRNSAIKALGLLGDIRAVMPLLCLLEQASPSYRRIFIIEALDRLGDLRTVEAFIACLTDPLEETEVRIASIEAVGHLAAKSAVPVLLPMLSAPTDDEFSEMRWRTAVALGQIGDTQAIPSLQPHLSDPEPVMCMAVSNALQQLELIKVVESAHELHQTAQ